MSEKRTKQIAVRITPETYVTLEQEAKRLKWSVAQLANEILTDWTVNHKDHGGAINFIIHNNNTINIK